MSLFLDGLDDDEPETQIEKKKEEFISPPPPKAKKKSLKKRVIKTPDDPNSNIARIVVELGKRIDQLQLDIGELRGEKSNGMNSELIEFITISVNLASKYAHTKKRWYLAKDKLNPGNHEIDKIQFEKLLELAEKLKK